jgi:hypothetical protein
LAQERGDLRGLDWLAEQVTLDMGASAGFDPSGLIRCFHALRDGGHSQPLAERHDRADHRRRFVVHAKAGNESLVYLDLTERKQPQPTE